MSTSVEHDGVPECDRAPRLRALPYDDPVAQYLVERVQQEYVERYGGPDGAVVGPGEFLPPRGLFLVAEVDGVPAGCGAWRAFGDRVAEIKRVYVEPAFRRQGLAQLLMAALERSASAAGHRSVVLNAGRRQPEALALYARLGYRTVPGYGIYADAPDARFLGKDLVRAPAEAGAVDGTEGPEWGS
ncbi:MAG: GCN5-related N-acetyltransferase [Blastococcus sp.]|nr:GCN5-related N-acetyltransferase [Blastococcus sp.]